MGRLVKPASPAPSGATESVFDGDVPAEQRRGDNYLERVAKYIPAEIVAFFIFGNCILKQALANANATRPAGAPAVDALMAGCSVIRIGEVVFWAAWLVVPVYLWRMRQSGDGWRTNALLGFLLFPFWAYAVEAVGITAHLAFDGQFASILLGGATLISGLIQPPQAAPVTELQRVGHQNGLKPNVSAPQEAAAIQQGS